MDAVLHDDARWNIGDPKDPDSLTPHQRLTELASILATGVHRLRTIPPALPEYRQIQAESSPTGLEPVETTCPDGSRCQPETTREE